MSKSINTGGFHDIPTTVNLSGSIIDWAQGNVFASEINSDTTFSFLNDTDGRTIVVKIKNTTASSLNLTWPSSVVSPNPFLGANVTKIVTLIKIGTSVYMASTEL
jgi:galactokinase